jgi:hypothetical protein
MEKIILAFCVLMLTGCPYGQPYFYPLGISVKNNMPCFSVPTKFFDSESMKNLGVLVAVYQEDKVIDSWDSPAESTDIYPNQCVTYPDFNWRAGEYSVLMGVMSEKDHERYRLRSTFTLDVQSNGDMVIRDIN